MTAHRKPAEPAVDFVRRHIGPSSRDIDAMLQTVGASSLQALMSETLPASIRLKAPLDLGKPLSEIDAITHMRGIAARNQVFTSLIGQGYSGTVLPAVIQRNILESPAWYTAYTPYQPEISQGRLEALFNFQTMICDLTGLDIANASLLDEGTAAAEAMALAERSSSVKTKAFFIGPKPGDKPVYTRGITSFLCTDEALTIFKAATDELTSMALTFPRFAPPRTDKEPASFSNAGALEHVRKFLAHAINQGHRGTPHR